MNICESVASPRTERVSGIENPLKRHQSDCSNLRVHTVLQCMVIPRSWSRPFTSHVEKGLAVTSKALSREAPRMLHPLTPICLAVQYIQA
uniref:Uncharacterized protein n=1 Tax=Anguilla anguilla TaxID=7936 RepID=A0A0E9SCX4_ANGAN